VRRQVPAGQEVLTGPHAVLEALRAGRRKVERILLGRAHPDPRVVEIARLAKARGISVEHRDRQRLDAVTKGGVHQGVVALVSGIAWEDPFELVGRIKARATIPLLLVLDGIQDPQNLGAIVRCAEAAGADALFLPKHGGVRVTAAVARAAAGAIEYLPVAQIPSCAAFLEWLKRHGIWIVGADPNAQRSVYDLDFRVPLALVIGGEHRGLRPLVRERCDLLASIPMRGRLASLNAAAAAAVCLFEIQRQRDRHRQESERA